MTCVPEDIRSYLADQLKRYDTRFCMQIAPADSLASWDELGVTCLTLDEHFDPRHDLGSLTGQASLAIVIDAPKVLSRAAVRLLLGGLRNHAAGAVIAAFAIDQARRDARWSTGDFLGLGFRRIGRPRQPDANACAYWLYRYDIYDYKITPDWLNSRHWANPERWGKHRW